MFVLGHFLDSLSLVIHTVATLIIWIVVARAVLSWVSPDPNNPIVRAIYQITEPLISPIRCRLPYLGGLDLAPIILIVSVMFLDNFFTPMLKDIGQSML